MSWLNAANIMGEIGANASELGKSMEVAALAKSRVFSFPLVPCCREHFKEYYHKS